MAIKQPKTGARTGRGTIGTNPLDAVVPDLRSLQNSSSSPSVNGAVNGAAPLEISEASNPNRKERLTIHLSTGLIERLKNAVFWTPGLTLADVGETAIGRLIDELEVEHGAPFEARAGELKGGRPLKRP